MLQGDANVHEQRLLNVQKYFYEVCPQKDQSHYGQPTSKTKTQVYLREPRIPQLMEEARRAKK